ncbi:Alpha/Beta hydrolase protein [Lasiosphaeria hispida]|uniref:Alpha/Beta hydrolase protein n=1 Tax=Lasiosphaeria hispida TaxID=260671 RepID=A0AAJ0HPB1_9PEZI|nr:Alpha/Beta hydrolase protein [Lasiosphaeria hispida]
MGDTVDTLAASGDEIKPYKIHIPSKFLQLTRRKLELTRLPHESASPKSEDWWEPKPEIEPLIDFWLETHSWRSQESQLNTIPQFRIPLQPTALPTVLRLHFIHIRSSSLPSAPPLLLLPPFPLPNLSLAHLGPLLPDFHLVIPALPGLAFSDPLPPNTHPLAASAALLDELMRRLGYPRYLVTTTAPATGDGDVNWRLARRMAREAGCVGTHMIAPRLAPPGVLSAPWAWVRWSVAHFFRAGILGYEEGDFEAMERAGRYRAEGGPPGGNGIFGLGALREPNTLAYALCDSPVGMLALVLGGLRAAGGRVGEEGFWTRERVVTLTELAWLPGPENAMRFWSFCEIHPDEAEPATTTTRPSVAITVFDGSGGDHGSAGPGESYIYPAWADTQYDVVHTQRCPGRSAQKGLLAFEQPEIIVEGVRGLAKALLSKNPRLFSPGEEASTAGGIAPLERVVVDGDRAKPVANDSGVTVTVTAEAGSGGKDKGKGKEVVESTLSPPAPLPVRDPLLDGESPDTLVEGAKTPPLEKASYS